MGTSDFGMFHSVHDASLSESDNEGRTSRFASLVTGWWFSFLCAVTLWKCFHNVQVVPRSLSFLRRCGFVSIDQMIYRQAALRVLTHALLTSSDVVRQRSTISDMDSVLLMECSFSDAARSWGSLN
jgi:hypothetical protein